jgi:cytosine/adenosine deaminase-related metal-dependent hydrolase
VTDATTERGWLPDFIYANGRFESNLAMFADSSGRITRFSRRPDDLAIATRLPNRAILPGLVNVHSHTFQRLIRGRTEFRTTFRRTATGALSSIEQGSRPDALCADSSVVRDTFWTWRESMYRAANSVTPEAIYRTARMAFLEMALSGITTVGEFHYIHHQPGGVPYENRNLLALLILRAADEVGIRIALLRTAYVRAGWNKDPDPGQIRFITPDVDDFLRDTDDLRKAVDQLTNPRGSEAFIPSRDRQEAVNAQLQNRDRKGADADSSIPRNTPSGAQAPTQSRDPEGAVDADSETQSRTPHDTPTPSRDREGAVNAQFLTRDREGAVDAQFLSRDREGAVIPPAHRAWVAVAPHSIRAVPLNGLREIAKYARANHLPLHMHVAEQPAEIDACLAEYNCRPVELLQRESILDPHFTAIHAIHITPEEAHDLGAARANVCACPTSERNLGDGAVPADQLFAAGASICFGSDSNIQIDILEDARELEYHLRMKKLERVILTDADADRDSDRNSDQSSLARRLFESATESGARSLGGPSGTLEIGRPADFFTVDLKDPSIAGADAATLLNHIVFSLERTAIRDVFVGGESVICDGRHPLQDEIVAEFITAQRELEIK